MKKATSFRKTVLTAMAAVLLCLLLAACGGSGNSPSVEELKTYRELSWEGTELTVKLGTNKSTGCEWKNEFGDDAIIDYSINRKFTLSDKGAASGQAVGILSAGFEGKSEGTTTITFTTPCDWDGNGPGYTYIVTVEVAADGTIVSAVGEEAEAPPAGPAAASGLDEYAGEYAFICTRFSAAYMSDMLEYDGEAQDIPDQYVDMPEMAGETVTLEADGTGYLYWGEDNQGPIDWWTVDGSALEFQAGVAVIEGTIIDGIMTVELDDGFWALFALPGADTSGIAPVSIDDYIDLLYGDGTETSPAEDMPLEGEYTLFAVQNDGYTVDSNEMEMYSTLTLNEGGTGSMTMDEDAMDIESWSAEDGMLTVVLTDGSSAQAVIGNGILELDIWGTGDMLLYYAQDGADISGYELMSVDEILAAYAADVPDSRLYALWSGLDTAAGVHLSYDRHVDYMDSDQSFDVHGKDGVYYSRRTTYVSGFENTVITFFRDGTAYNLYPEDMTGLIATTTTSSFFAENIMRMDDLYSDIWQHAQETDYTEETRELDGVSYTVEVFPATEYTPEAAFYFDDAGELAYYVAGAPVVESAIDIGESVYTIHTIDDAVDEALFDISGYDIAE